MTADGNPRCECPTGPETAWAGPAIALCHHSTAAEAAGVMEKLLAIMEDFPQNIDPKTMSGKTIARLAEDYRQQAAGNIHRKPDRDEHMVININFMRTLSLTAEMIMCAMIIQRNEEKDEAQGE